MAKRTKGITVTYWSNGALIREYHDDAVRLGCKFYIGEQFDVLFDNLGRVLASYRNGSIVSVEDYNC